MTTWFIYLEENYCEKRGKMYKSRRYYRRKLSDKEIRKSKAIVKYIGTAELDSDYFIPGSVARHFDVTDLNDVICSYEASLPNGRVSRFSHSFQELLERAKDGILPYISFKEFKVLRAPVISILGQDHKSQ